MAKTNGTGRKASEIETEAKALALIPENKTNSNSKTLLPECRKLDAVERMTLKALYEDMFTRRMTDEQFQDVDSIAVIVNGRARVSDEYGPGPARWGQIEIKRQRRKTVEVGGVKTTEQVETVSLVHRLKMHPMEDMRLRRDYPEVFKAFDAARLARLTEGAKCCLDKQISHMRDVDYSKESLKDVAYAAGIVSHNLSALSQLSERAAMAGEVGKPEDPVMLKRTIIEEFRGDPGLLKMLKEMAGA